MPLLQPLAHAVDHLVSRQPIDGVSDMAEAVENLAARLVEVPSRVLKRNPSSTSDSASSSHTCAANDKSAGCEKPALSGNIATPIVLATVIPICLALLIFFFLHRRHVRKLRAEDERDPHKSLDFGLDEVGSKPRGKLPKSKIPEMSIQETEKELRRGRGMSLDMGASNPYLLPPGLQSSRESLHSLSRSLNNNSDDPYRPATQIYGNDAPFPRSNTSSLRNPDDSSSFTGSSRRGFPMNESSQNLVRNAQRSSRSMPPTRRESLEMASNGPYPPARGLPIRPTDFIASQDRRGAKSPLGNDETTEPPNPFMRSRNNQSPAQMPGGRPPSVLQPLPVPMSPPRSDSPPPPPAKEQSPSPPRKSPPQAFAGLPSNPKPKRDIPRSSSPVTVPDVSPFRSSEDDMVDRQPELPRLPDLPQDFDTNFHVDPPPAETDSHDSVYPNSDAAQLDTIEHGNSAQSYQQDLGYDAKRLTVGIRPLPPDDPSENPEQRANRIRSFYKEYFDDSTPGPVGNRDVYYDDYGVDLGAYDTPIYNPESDQYVSPNAPYAENISRRAMTPPPRFRGAGGHQGSFSGDFGYGGPRAMSSASGRFGPARRPPPKRALPPPQPLATLPTPHMLKLDTFIPTDFAPPQSYNDRLRGARPDSPKGGFRSFSPSIKPHKALVSSFDDLAVIPSPHALRKSGTFTSLDFAPPPRFRNADTASDAGSIRSNRSAMSAAAQMGIRNGAYRLSRVPKDQVGTREDLASALKPSWDMRV